MYAWLQSFFEQESKSLMIITGTSSHFLLLKTMNSLFNYDLFLLPKNRLYHALGKLEIIALNYLCFYYPDLLFFWYRNPTTSSWSLQSGTKLIS